MCAERVTNLSLMSLSSSDTAALDTMTRTVRHFIQSEKAFYEGIWCDALRHGNGKQVYADGTEYDGCWVENERHGSGKLSFVTGG